MLTVTQRQVIYSLALIYAEELRNFPDKAPPLNEMELLSLCPPLKPSEAKTLAYTLRITDGEIVGLDADGCIVQWNGEGQVLYNCGETPDQFDSRNMTAKEAERLNITGKDT